MKSLSRVQLLATPWTAAHQAPLSMGFSRQEYGSGVPLSFPYGTMNWFKIGKGGRQAIYCHPAYLTYMQSTSCEMSGWMKLKLE